MTLRHLEIFLAVAETGSMRKAAEQLYISQPTVSGAIREMEEEYDVLLFERLNQRLFITPEGRQLTIYARELLSLFHEMEYTLRHSSDHAILRIGATLTVGTCVLPEILRQLEEQKHIPTSVQVENTRTIVQRLAEGALDIGFVEGEVHHPDLVVLPVMADSLTAVCAHAAPPMTLAELCQTYPLLMREKGSGTREMTDRILAKKGISCDIRWECSNTQTLLQAAESGLGVTIISRLLAADAIAAGRLFEIPLTDCELRRSFRLVWHKNKFQGDSFLAFCHLCRQYAAACHQEIVKG